MVKQPLVCLLAFIIIFWSSLNHSETRENLSTTTASENNVEKTVLVVGDSISAAFGINPKQGWVQIIAREFQGKLNMVNASISGDTSTGGRFRLGKLLAEHRPDLVVIELGGNDGLRGTPIPQIQSNLKEMIQQAQKTQAQVLLLGMRIPPNYGERYTEMFAGLYQTVANSTGVLFVPFFLDGVAGVDGMMQDDGIHPAEQAQDIMAKHVAPVLQKWLDTQN